MSRLVAWIAFVLAGLAFAPGARSGELRLCNVGEQKFSYAVLASTSQMNLFGVSEWTAHGWYELDPNDCAHINSAVGTSEAFLSLRYIVEEEDDLRQLGMFVIKDVPDNFQERSLLSGAERLFCVRSEAFRRSEQSIEAHEQCPPGYYLQVFNMFIYAGTDIRFTADVN